MCRGLTFLLPFLFLGHVSLLFLGYFAINAILTSCLMDIIVVKTIFGGTEGNVIFKALELA